MAEPARKAAAATNPARARLGVVERRAQLVALGLELFGKQPYDELSIDDIARSAGISKGLLYHYFPSKRDFYVATVRAGAAQLLDVIDAATAEADPVGALDAGIDAYLSYTEAHGDAFVSLMRSGIGVDREVGEIVESVRLHFLGKLLEGLTAPDEALLHTAMRGFVGFVEASVLDWVELRRLSRDQTKSLLLQTAASIALGVGASPKALAPA